MKLLWRKERKGGDSSGGELGFIFFDLIGKKEEEKGEEIKEEKNGRMEGKRRKV